jgi:hypothetical protein
VHLHFFGGGSTVPAISRKIKESQLIEEYHWLPQDIAKIPYKKLQELELIRSIKNKGIQQRQAIAKAKQQNSTVGVRRFTREI